MADGARIAVSSVSLKNSKVWAQDYHDYASYMGHIPLFSALRQMSLLIDICINADEVD